MDFNKICSDIKSLKIQGALSVAKAGADALYFYFLQNKKNKNIIKKLKIASNKLIKTRATEPALRNVVSYYFLDINNCKNLKELELHIKKQYIFIKNHFDDSKNKIMEIGYKKIKKNYIVYTHCHSSLVCDILKYAWKKGIKFEVYNTETRPLYQGRKTALELSKIGIPVTHFVDSAAKHAIKKADLVLLGVDAISTTKIYNKIGSETIAMLASHYDVPVYFCTDSWKFDSQTMFGYDEEIEKRHAKEVWDISTKKIKIHNYAFDQVSPKYITGIISEIGVFDHSTFVDISRKNLEKISQIK